MECGAIVLQRDRGPQAVLAVHLYVAVAAVIRAQVIAVDGIAWPG